MIGYESEALMTACIQEELNWTLHKGNRIGQMAETLELGPSEGTWVRLEVCRILEGFTGACGLCGSKSEYRLGPAVRSDVSTYRIRGVGIEKDQKCAIMGSKNYNILPIIP